MGSLLLNGGKGESIFLVRFILRWLVGRVENEQQTLFNLHIIQQALRIVIYQKLNLKKEYQRIQVYSLQNRDTD